MVFQHRRSGEGSVRRRHASRRPGAVDALSGRGDLRIGHRAARCAEMADQDFRIRFPHRHECSPVSAGSRGRGPRRAFRLLLQHAGVVHASRRPHAPEHRVGLEPRDAPGDTHFACYRGTRSGVEVRQIRADGFRPELYVVPNSADTKSQVLAAVRTRVASLDAQFPGIAVEDRGGEIQRTTPGAPCWSRSALRPGHRELPDPSDR